jgi:hypothetical protein
MEQTGSYALVAGIPQVTLVFISLLRPTYRSQNFVQSVYY